MTTQRCKTTMKTTVLFLATVTLALAQSSLLAQSTPQLIIPGQEKKLELDSKKLATAMMPTVLTGLGTLRTSVVAYFPMDSADYGGLAWSAKPLNIIPHGEIEAKKAGARKFLDFSKKGARVKIEPPLETGATYTLTAWAEFPTPGKHGVLWKGSSGMYMMFIDWGLGYYDKAKTADVPWAKAPKGIKGWHHVAVTFDGTNSQAFLDGRALAVVKGRVGENLEFYGANDQAAHEHWMMCGGVDEQIIFNRALTAAEVAAVMTFTKPKS